METEKTPICLRSLCINYLLFGSFLTLADRLLLGFVNNDLSELQLVSNRRLKYMKARARNKTVT